MGIITYDTLRSFTYSNDALITGAVNGIAVSFMGLGGSAMYAEDPDLGVRLAGQGIIYLIPYLDPWNWMNDQAVAYTDEIINVLFEKYALPEGLPVVASGGSMGGLCALVYTRYARRMPCACVTNCPVCDAAYHFTERPDLPRTFYAAFGTAADFDAALKAHSPMHLVDSMPDVRYIQFHCGADQAVNKAMHSDRFVAAMRGSHRIEYHEVPGRGHCDLDEENKKLYEDLIADSALGR